MPRHAKVGNEELENWLATQLHPGIDFRIYEFSFGGKPAVLFEVPAAAHTPVRFKTVEFIRVGTYKKPLKDFPEKERTLWALLSRTTFEREVAARDVAEDDVLKLLDYPAYFDLTGQSLPDNRAGLIDRLQRERFIAPAEGDHFHISRERDR
jgi:ATP-dependent DNA helicase RecG